MAVAFDAGSGANGSTGTSQTLSHTCSGSNRILWVGCFSNNNSIPSAMTYNGVAMTAHVSKLQNSPNSNESIALRFLVAPATGANNIVVTWSTSNPNPSVSGASFTDGTQSAVTEGTQVASGASAASASGTVVTSADNCFSILLVRATGGAGDTAGTNSTRVIAGAIIGNMFYSTTAKTPAGSMSQTVNFSPNSSWALLYAPFPPAAAAAGPANLKSYNTNLKANIKSIDTNLIANVKSLNTNT